MDTPYKQAVSIWDILKTLEVGDETNAHPVAVNVLNEIADEAKQLAFAAKVLQAILPSQYLPVVRLAVTSHAYVTSEGVDKFYFTWVLNVESAVAASRLKILLPSLTELIAEKYNYQAKLKTKIVPKNFKQSGLNLCKIQVKKDKRPSKEEADQIIDSFLKTVF